MADSTLKKDGPSNHRKLKVKSDSSKLTVKGWLNVGHEYAMGSKFLNGAHDIVESEELSGNIASKMGHNES